MKIYEAKQISVSIRCTPNEVYRFASAAENLPKWAAGLADASLKKSGDGWVTNSPMGEVKIKFVAENSFGVLDHDVTLPNGDVIHNPLRVLKNGEGSEVVFTLFRLPQMTEESFKQDAAMVESDLKKLKLILEAKN